MSCGADTEANALIQSLTAGEDFVIPDINWDDDAFKFPGGTDGPLYQPVQRITVGELTTREVGGSGVFDALMASFSAHLRAEYEKSRITGDDYTKTYIALSESAMANATQFLLGKDEAFWSAQTAQLQAFTARIGLETAKAEMANTQLQALNQKATFALTKLKLSSESVTFCTAQYNLLNILPKQVEKLTLENAGQTLQNSTADFNLTRMLPEQLAILGLEKIGQGTANSTSLYNLNSILPEQLAASLIQKAGQEITNNTATYNLSNLLPKQAENLVFQGEMLKEQTEAQRAQTLDVRKDGSVVVGVLGKQKDLYKQQITSYQRDSEVKAGKLFTDAWITMKTIDEGLLPPNGFTNTSLDTILTALKTNNNLD